MQHWNVPEAVNTGQGRGCTQQLGVCVCVLSSFVDFTHFMTARMCVCAILTQTNNVLLVPTIVTMASTMLSTSTMLMGRIGKDRRRPKRRHLGGWMIDAAITWWFDDFGSVVVGLRQNLKAYYRLLISLSPSDLIIVSSPRR